MAEEAGRVRIGTEAWEKMSEAEREEAVKCHLGDCHDHLRNIIIKAMSTEATNYLQGHALKGARLLPRTTPPS